MTNKVAICDFGFGDYPDGLTFDTLVMENLLADILSDLGGGLVGGMGMATCAEIGLSHALFQPAHGNAPDIT